MALWKRNVILSIFVIVLAVLPLVMLKDAEFSGADDLAETAITEINPDYKPWFSSIYEPESGEIESLLFAVQAAIGAGVVGFVLGRITSKKGE
ncbi:MAG: energy-coupling factor ABC transporter substrate-binding protein [Mucispirillum sp.]|uniref:Cobalt transport protein CbiN n=1 Tax=Candidatus Mucispirillum faecigallinarum TaxID=2838699 RepID=A0A9D2GUX3_9BACT|nr:energy-coupling factor ABC transporter substrate-binding protein [Mucispirillum sp.]HIZ90462.1 energy-coupling factor ABC transporter substrate-binding protein [Candidatus Mucispirillum faecigallinarum]